MDVIEYRFVGKTGWGVGPWLDEPDKVQWPDPETGLACMARRNPALGIWCGYVGVPEGHPWFGVDADRIDADVHGGLTFAGMCDEGVPAAEAICHVPAPGEPEHLYWLGFDCGHAYDLVPYAALVPARFQIDLGSTTYRDLGYVRAECAKLARQAAEASAVSRPAAPDEE
jgi:hypothetical protein